MFFFSLCVGRTQARRLSDTEHAATTIFPSRTSSRLDRPRRPRCPRTLTPSGGAPASRAHRCLLHVDSHKPRTEDSQPLPRPDLPSGTRAEAHPTVAQAPRSQLLRARTRIGDATRPHERATRSVLSFLVRAPCYFGRGCRDTPDPRFEILGVEGQGLLAALRGAVRPAEDGGQRGRASPSWAVTARVAQLLCVYLDFWILFGTMVCVGGGCSSGCVSGTVPTHLEKEARCFSFH